MRYLPLHFDLQGRDVLVVGGGEIARRKIELLLRSGAHITVVSPDISGPVAAILQEKIHVLNRQVYAPGFLPGKCLVVAGHCLKIT